MPRPSGILATALPGTRGRKARRRFMGLTMSVGYRYVNGMRVPVVPRADFDWSRTINQLCEAQNWRCCYCGIRMVMGERRKDGDSPTVEHVVPRVSGGDDNWDNLVAACRLCNVSRGAMKSEKFLQFVKWRGREKACAYAVRLKSKIMRRERERRAAVTHPEGVPPND